MIWISERVEKIHQRLTVTREGKRRERRREDIERLAWKESKRSNSIPLCCYCSIV
jgi:hypothetical protein